MDDVVLGSKPIARLPQWAGPARAAGVIDEIDERGMGGWIFDPLAEHERIAFEVRCGQRIVGRGETGLPRPEVGKALESAENLGFLVGWPSIDFLELAAACAEDERAAMEIFVPSLGRYLAKYSENPRTAAFIASDASKFRPDLFAGGDIRTTSLAKESRGGVAVGAVSRAIEGKGERKLVAATLEAGLKEVARRSDQDIRAANQSREGQPLVRKLERWFETETQFAGALDTIGPATGMSGWVLSKNDPTQSFAVEVMSHGRVLAHAWTDIFRPDLSDALGVTTNCGFQIAWSKFDVAAVIEVLADDPQAGFELLVPTLNKHLARFSDVIDIEAISLGDCFDYIKKAGHVEARHMLLKQKLAQPAADIDQKISSGTPNIDLIAQSGLFDPIYYSISAREIAASGLSPLAHYVLHGEARGIRPNPFFDPKWYAFKYLSPPSLSGALAHYIEHGERIGNKPCDVFEPKWYAETYGVNVEEQLALSHYLQNRFMNTYNPNRFFDVEFYLRSNSDLANANVDGFTHWFNWGLFEGRKGSENFNASYVWQRYLANDRTINAFASFMDVGIDLGWAPSASGKGVSVYRQVAANAAPGPLFEGLGPKVELASNSPKVVALYLPQFHAIAENDEWWGAGFTEWRNIPRGLPRFEGHVQPRIPRDLGFYTLEGSATIRLQVELARRSGVHGFCFYYYNFNGHRLLERPVETFLAEGDIEFPFCIMWANENWSRRWDGSDREVLIHQDYRHEDLDDLVDDIARHMRDPRYMRTSEGRPLFYVYRADVIPDCRNTIAAWRERFRSAHGLDPLIVMAQAFGVEDPRPLGFDGAVEFPPHKLAAKIPLLNHALRMLDYDFDANVVDYEGIVRESLATLDAPFPLVKTAFPSWDNDARRQGHGMVFANSTPKAFHDWMTKLLHNAMDKKFFGESIVFVNAWNEWCEGAYLEPDTHFGYAYLNALGRALKSLQADFRRVVLIGHDAFPSGAQHLLLNMGTIFARAFGMEVRFVLMVGGAMAPQYGAVAKTFVASDEAHPSQALRAHLVELRKSGFDYALTNTVVAGSVTAVLEELGFSFCSLIHELPTLIRGSMLEPYYLEIGNRAKAVVYPSKYVKTSLDKAFGEAKRPAIVRPQGVYHQPEVPADACKAVRDEFGIGKDSRIVINVGYADLRKGVDLFVGLAEQVALLDPDVHFVWVGGVHPDIRPWLDLDLRKKELRNVHFKPFTKDVGRYLGAADLFLLTSREDPFPSVVLEALAVGLPVAAFENSGGHVELLGNEPALGALLPFGAGPENARRIIELLGSSARTGKKNAAYRRDLVKNKFDFTLYCSDLLGLLEPRYRTVSVIVPNYNYARYLRERLHSIFAQSYPVLEILVLDDASVDESMAVARDSAEDAARTITIDRRDTNSGNAFRQWKAGLDRARGEFVWIAEADDSSDPKFLRETVRRLTEDLGAAFCFTDSCAIGPDGSVMYESYKSYCSQLGDDGLDKDGRFDGRDFLRRFLTIRNLVLNASSVVWRTEKLRNAFASLGDEAFSLTCAGDWRIYLEVCRQAEAVLYTAAPLNRHRRHDDSITHALSKREHLDEIMRVQAIALKECGNDPQLANRVAAWQTELRQEWRLEGEMA